MPFFDIGGKATGIIAIGQIATGFLAIGQMATGVIAIGQVSRGFFAVGQGAIGLVAIGQGAIGVFYTIGMLGIGGRSKIGMLLVPLIPDLAERAENHWLALAQFIGWLVVFAAVWFIALTPVIGIFWK